MLERQVSQRVDRVSAEDLVQPQIQEHLANDQSYQALVTHQAAIEQRQEDTRA